VKKKIGLEETFLDGVVVEHDWIYLAAQLDDLDTEIYRHTRITGFDKYIKDNNSDSEGWFYHDLELHIVSVCVKKKTQKQERRLCALSREGDVEIYAIPTGTDAIEKIPGAGLVPGDIEQEGIAGYVTNMREIGTSLYVCGMNGQIYRRPPEGGWLAIDGGLCKPMTYIYDEPSNLFTCIDGNSECDVYVVGMQGVVYHYDGWNWQKVPVPTDEHLQWIRCYGQNEVYICGDNGVLLKGSAKKGFKDVSSVEDNLTWWCLCKFGDKVYLSSTQGLYAWDGENITPVVTGLEPEIETWRVDSDGEKALWSLGTKDLAWFDGTHWQRLHNPSNPKIGES